MLKLGGKTVVAPKSTKEDVTNGHERTFTTKEWVLEKLGGGSSDGIRTQNTAYIELSGDGTDSDPLKAELTQGLMDYIQIGVDHDLDSVTTNGNITSNPIIILQEEGNAVTATFLNPGGIRTDEINQEPYARQGTFVVDTQGISAYYKNLYYEKLIELKADYIGLIQELDGKEMNLNFPIIKDLVKGGFPTGRLDSIFFPISVNGVFADSTGNIEIEVGGTEIIQKNGNFLVTPDLNNKKVYHRSNVITIELESLFGIDFPVGYHVTFEEDAGRGYNGMIGDSNTEIIITGSTQTGQIVRVNNDTSPDSVYNLAAYRTWSITKVNENYIVITGALAK